MCMDCNLLIPNELHKSLRFLLGNPKNEYGMCNICGEDIVHLKGAAFRCNCCGTDYYLKPKNAILSDNRDAKEKEIANTIKRNIQNIQKINTLKTKIMLIEMRLSDDSLPQLKKTYSKYKNLLDVVKQRWEYSDENACISTKTAMKILEFNRGVCDVMRIKHPEYYDLYKIHISNVGDSVLLGNYQGVDLSWIIISKNGNRVEMLLNSVLKVDSFETSGEWFDSKIRRFLNNEFIDSTFSAEIRKTIGGNFYNDDCRLLSKKELLDIFPNQQTRLVEHFSESGYISELNEEKDYLSWFLLPEDLSDVSWIPAVSDSGEIISVSKIDECGVRPVIQITLPFISTDYL